MHKIRYRNLRNAWIVLLIILMLLLNGIAWLLDAPSWLYAVVTVFFVAQILIGLEKMIRFLNWTIPD